MKIIPQPGYLFCKPYIQKQKVFKSAKETVGEDQMSEVLEVGPDVLDDKGNLRTTSVKKKDVILHAYSNKTLEVDFEEYRFVHFTEVHATYES